MTPGLVHIFEWWMTKDYSSQPQDIGSCHDSKNQKNAPAILQFLNALEKRVI